jgi:type IV secretion system protein VirB11
MEFSSPAAHLRGRPMGRVLLSLANGRNGGGDRGRARKLHLPHENSVAVIAERAERSERAPAKLLAALRIRPERLILGEMRREEALAFSEALNTRHPGLISTIRGVATLAFERLALMLRSGSDHRRDRPAQVACGAQDLFARKGCRGRAAASIATLDSPLDHDRPAGALQHTAYVVMRQ